MAELNEDIGGRANREEGVQGRFWAGRYKSRRLLDEKAIAACPARCRNCSTTRASLRPELF